MSENLVGRTLMRRYRVDSFVAPGGMGAVYKAWDLQRNVWLAMKVLSSDLAEDPVGFRSFQREANALKILTHPNIVPFYGLEQSDDLVFLLEDFIDGPSLKDILKKRRALPIPEALTILQAMCAALGYAHAMGMTHCDVKPGNVMVNRGGNIYLADFGIVRHSDSTVTSTFAGAGTPGYMAPEQVLGRPVNSQTDIYSLGVVLYEMLTGQRPFQGTEPEAQTLGNTINERVRLAHVKLAAPDPRRINPNIPEALAQVVLKALVKQPAGRFRSMQEFFAAAVNAAGCPPAPLNLSLWTGAAKPPDTNRVPVPPRPVEYPPPEPPEQPAKKRSLTPIIVTAAAVIIFAVLVLPRLIPPPVIYAPTPTIGGVGITPLPGDNTNPTGLPPGPTSTSFLDPATEPPIVLASSTPWPTNTPVPTYTTEPSVFLPRGRLAVVHTEGDTHSVQIVSFDGSLVPITRLENSLSNLGRRTIYPPSGYNRAWWPDWCDYDQTIVLEAQNKTDSGTTQSIFRTASDGSGGTERLAQNDISGTLGVARCSYGGSPDFLVSMNAGPGWSLFRGGIYSSSLYEVSNTTPFAGNASWSSDNSWIAYIHKEGDAWRVIRYDFSSGSPSTLYGSGTNQEKYPAVNPATGQIAYACDANGQWNLCYADQNLNNARLVAANLMSVASPPTASGTTIPQVTPWWSPDGKWIAYTSYQNGNFDVYLYSVELDQSFNLTRSWGGDEFEPNWSKYE